MGDVDIDKLRIIRYIIIVACFAAAIIYTIIKILHQQQWIKKRGIKAEGKIVQLVEKIEKGTYRNEFVDTVTYFPVIEYRIQNWEKIKRQHYVDREPSAYKIGDSVPIIYDSKNPERFVIER
jgi:hypothetical protein